MAKGNGELNRNRRSISWSLLRVLSSKCSLPQLCVGDYNNLSGLEKKGGNPQPSYLISGFNEVVGDAGLFDLKMEGYEFTQQRGKGTWALVEDKLDRVMTSHDWIAMFADYQVMNLAYTSSDHSPNLVLPFKREEMRHRSRFRFENLWMEEAKCVEFVCISWNELPHQYS